MYIYIYNIFIGVYKRIFTSLSNSARVAEKSCIYHINFPVRKHVRHTPFTIKISCHNHYQLHLYKNARKTHRKRKIKSKSKQNGNKLS